MISSENPSLNPASLHPLLWRGKQVRHRVHTLSTGHPVLDEVLPGCGWPTGAVTELVNDAPGCGELSLLLPALARLSRENRWITMIDPPWIPCPAALHGRGLALEKLLLVNTKSRNESLWACEQIVRGISGGAMLAWPGVLSFSELRRLQLAAKNSRHSVFMFSDQAAAKASSPATLRLQLTANNGDLRIRVLKCRGRRPASGIRIRRPQLLQPVTQGTPDSNQSDQHLASAAEVSGTSPNRSRNNQIPL
jgi:hypothetical protein